MIHESEEVGLGSGRSSNSGSEGVGSMTSGCDDELELDDFSRAVSCRAKRSEILPPPLSRRGEPEGTGVAGATDNWLSAWGFAGLMNNMGRVVLVGLGVVVWATPLFGLRGESALVPLVGAPVARIRAFLS